MQGFNHGIGKRFVYYTAQGIYVAAQCISLRKIITPYLLIKLSFADGVGVGLCQKSENRKISAGKRKGLAGLYCAMWLNVNFNLPYSRGFKIVFSLLIHHYLIKFPCDSEF